MDLKDKEKLILEISYYEKCLRDFSLFLNRALSCMRKESNGGLGSVRLVKVDPISGSGSEEDK